MLFRSVMIPHAVMVTIFGIHLANSPLFRGCILFAASLHQQHHCSPSHTVTAVPLIERSASECEQQEFPSIRKLPPVAEVTTRQRYLCRVSRLNTVTAELYPDVTFIALDVAQGDLGEDYTVPSNVYCAVYQEELCGYMAGYAAVKLGYTHLGVLGGMAVPAVQRFGYGFVQGADAAAVEMGIADQVVMEYAYGNQFYGDSDITAYMDNWYQTLGVEVVFASGGGIYTSAAEAAAKVGGKLIGVDVDQSANIDTYGEGMCVTSAMKGLAETVKHMLGEVVAGNFANYGGQVETLGLVSGDDPTANYVQLPMETTQWGDGFTQDDYKALVKAMYDGDVTVSNDISAMPATTITVNFAGNIK